MLDQSNGVAEMAAAVDSMLDGFATLRAVCDETGSIVDFEVTYVNKAAEREMHCERDGLIGQRLSQFLPAVDSLGVMDMWRDVVATGKPVMLCGVPSGPRNLGAMLDLSAWRFRDGVAVRWRAVTEQAEALRLESLGRLAGGVAHDFNNLLAVISNYAAFVSGAIEASLASNDVAPLGEAVSDVTQIAQAAQRASTRTRQLLAFARRQHAHPRPLDVNQVVATVLRDHAARPGVVVMTRCAVNLPAVVADALQLEEALGNLITNADEAMPHGGELCVVTSYACRGSERGVEITVRDNGVGMTDGVRAQAFEPFFTTKGIGDGAGLGLATVHGIVNRAGGTVEIQSARGEGTRVVMWFPAGAETDVDYA